MNEKGCSHHSTRSRLRSLPRILLIVSLLLISLTLSQSIESGASQPIYYLCYDVEGEILDMWIEGDCCYFVVKISKADSICSPYDPETLRNQIFTVVAYPGYEVANPSSMGWRIGDVVSGRLHIPSDGVGDGWLRIHAKSDVNYAESATFGIKTSIWIIA